MPDAMPDAIRTPADRLFKRRCQVAGVLCLLAYLALSQTSLRLPQGPLHTTLGGLSGAFFVGELVSFGLLVNRKFDEFQRVLLVRSFLWATVLTMALITVYGCLELASHSTVPRIPLVFLPIVLILLTAFTKVLIFRRNRAAE